MKPKHDKKIFVPEHIGAHVILQGDDGGQIYFTCPATKIKCSEAGLKKVLAYLDGLSWNDASAARVFFEDRREGSGVPGGMGGGLRSMTFGCIRNCRSWGWRRKCAPLLLD